MQGQPNSRLQLMGAPTKSGIHSLHMDVNGRAVALGAFGLALAANVHWLLAATPGQRAPLIALPAWPVITAVPAFVLALAAAAVLARVSRRA